MVQAFELYVDVATAGPVRDPQGVNTFVLDVGDQDEFHYRWVGDTSFSTGVVKVQDVRHPNEPWLDLAALTLDETAQEVDITGSAQIRVSVTAAEASKSGRLYFMVRRAQEL